MRGHGRTIYVGVRLTPDEKGLLDAAAARRGETVSDVVRRLVALTPAIEAAAAPRERATQS